MAVSYAPISSGRDPLALAMLRTAFVSWCACIYRAYDLRSAATDAADRAGSPLLVMSINTTTAAAHAHGVVVQGALAAALQNAATIDCAGIASDLAAAAASAMAGSDGAAQVWTSISSDMSYLSEMRSPDYAEVARELMGQPMWLIDVRGDPKFQANFPRWIRTPFDSMAKDTELIQKGFAPWIAWYRAILPNGRTVRPTSYFGEAVDLRIASQPDTWWSREPARVNEEIAGWRASPIFDNLEGIRTRLERVPSVDRLESIAKSNEVLPSHPTPVGKRRPRVKRNPTADEVSIHSGPVVSGLSEEPKVSPPTLSEPIQTSAIETSFLDDSTDPDVDFLSRSDLAFVLAGRLNQIWDQLNAEKPQDDYAGNSARWTGLWPKRPAREPPPGFVVHIDAPWGGGKTSFANFLIRLLNPYRVAGPPPAWMLGLPLGDSNFWPEACRRPWYIVTFNAWQHQHVMPPWWVFYQAIRKQTTDAVFAEDLLVEPAPATYVSGTSRPSASLVPPPPAVGQGYLRPWLRALDWSWCWLREMAWRVWTPDIRNKAAVTVFGIAAVVLLFRLGFLKIDAKLDQSVDTAVAAKTSLYPYVSVVIAALLGGAPLVWTVLSTLSSTLLSGTPDAAKNYALGSGDPLDRFRAHFARMMLALKRPVLVVVDDLDRCEPTFVVELIRGMQTILKSPRLVFILLGDRDWIEECFTKVNEAMKGIHVGPEHEFGARFAEKAIQFSFVLPDISDATRRTYVRDLLGVKRVASGPDQDGLPMDVVFEADASMRGEFEFKVDSVLQQDEALGRESAAQTVREEIKASPASDAVTDALLADFDRKLSLRAATDKTAEAATRHRLEALSSVLPPNPRQIKRIINAITLLQEVARIEQRVQPGSTEWKILALWIILMIEWPKSWFTLSTYPGLANRLLNQPDESVPHLPVDNTHAFLVALKANSEVMAIIKFQGDQEWQDCAITTAHVLKLRQILPPASGQLIEVAPPKKTDSNQRV
ncbi:MAG: hypothetical protein EKK31_28985 [Hyphomicrobiales bacterium]|nr:MAG: hypothetical protein EKK31_28985 [Hyphomicrobiales bacterium]